MPRMMLSRMKNTRVTTRACLESPPLATGMGGTSRRQELLAREAYHRARERDALTASREGQPGQYRAKGCRLFGSSEYLSSVKDAQALSTPLVREKTKNAAAVPVAPNSRTGRV